MSEHIKEKFSFLNFINEDISNLEIYGLDKDENLEDPSVILCIKSLFKVADENEWLIPKQKLSTAVKQEFERIYKDIFINSD